MKRRRTIVGLSVLCALCFSAFAASSASAKGTTIFECASGAGSLDFSDAHCDKPVTPGTGTFGHKSIANNTPITVSVANDLTGTASPFFLEGKLAGVVVKVECAKVVGTGFAQNEEVGGVMKINFGGELHIAKTTFSNCRVLTQPECTIANINAESVQTDPMNLKLGAEKEPPTGLPKIKTVEEAAGATEMGLKFTPPAAAGGVFATLTFGGAGCPAAIAGNKTVKGFTYATGGRGSTEATTSSGATAIFTAASSLGGLTFGGNPATLEGTLTFRAGSSTGNPLTITTTAN